MGNVNHFVVSKYQLLCIKYVVAAFISDINYVKLWPVKKLWLLTDPLYKYNSLCLFQEETVS